VPLLLNQDESITDLELGASAGVTPSATVSPPVQSAAQRKATYEQRGFNVKTKVKTTPPTTVITSTPKSATVQSGKADQPQSKIPLKRRRLSSEVESSDLSMPEALTTSKPWNHPDEEVKSLSGGAPGQPKYGRKGLPSQGRKRHKTPVCVEASGSRPMPNEPEAESARPTEYESLVKAMDELRKEMSELKRRGHYRAPIEEHREWSSRGGGRPRYSDEPPHARWRRWR